MADVQSMLSSVVGAGKNHLAVWPNIKTWVRLAQLEYERQICYGDL